MLPCCSLVASVNWPTGTDRVLKVAVDELEVPLT